MVTWTFQKDGLPISGRRLVKLALITHISLIGHHLVAAFDQTQTVFRNPGCNAGGSM